MHKASMIVGLMLMATAGAAAAQTPPGRGATRTLFVGEARMTNMFSGAVAHDPVLLVRDVNAAAGTIEETACAHGPDGKALVSPAYIRIQGADLTLSDARAGKPIAVAGTGHAWGPPGAWTRLHFSMTYSGAHGSVGIEDDNYVLPNEVIARKVISLPDGRPVQLWEIEMTPVDAAAFSTAWLKAGCAAF